MVDILVIGTGISGLTYAIKIAEKNPKINLTLISKCDINEGNTQYAQGGIAVVNNFKKDSIEKHVNDTITAGDGACNIEVVRFVIEEGNHRLNELIKWGAEFDKNKDQFDLLIEGGHTEKRIFHNKDQTGKQIQKVLNDKVKSFPNITILENHTLVDLITDHHLKENKKRCYGAYVISQEKEKIIKIVSKITVLSSGGAGNIYSQTTNPSVATGDGLGAAYRAKVLIDYLPYVQFHPTTLRDKIDDKVFLITEAVRGAGAKLRDFNGQRFMLKIDPRGELASRDIVAREIQKQIQKNNQRFVWLDGSEISKEKWKSKFPNIYNKCKSIGINLPKDPIPVVPAAHYFCGGIKVNDHSESSLKGLYAIGECSYTGLHGANRLASNSLLEALVFSHRAAMDGIRSLKRTMPDKNFYNSIPEWKGEGYSNNEVIENIKSLRLDLQETMTNLVGIFKTVKGLKKAERKINDIYKKVNRIYSNNKLTNDLCELRNMVSIAYLMIKKSQEIKENIGVFFNYNYEKKLHLNDNNFQKHS